MRLNAAVREMMSRWLLGNGEGRTEKISEFVKYIIPSFRNNEPRSHIVYSAVSRDNERALVSADVRP